VAEVVALVALAQTFADKVIEIIQVTEHLAETVD
jgi:hypothetical protein